MARRRVNTAPMMDTGTLDMDAALVYVGCMAGVPVWNDGRWRVLLPCGCNNPAHPPVEWSLGTNPVIALQTLCWAAGQLSRAAEA